MKNGKNFTIAKNLTDANKFVLEDRGLLRREGMLVVIIVSAAIMTAAVAALKKMGQGNFILLLLSSLLFCVMLALSMERNRLDKGVLDEKANNFIRVAITWCICCVTTAAGILLPDYVRPVIALSVMMSMVSTPYIGLIAGMYFSLFLCVAGGGSIYLFASYLLLCICGSMITEYMRRSNSRFWDAWIIFSVSFCTVLLFTCLEVKRATEMYFIYGLLNGFASCISVLWLHQNWYVKIESKKENILETMLKEDYGLVQAMKSYSKADYEHALRVSKIARECAKLIEADPNIAAVGGFYYRLGRLEGEPYVENGVSVALSHGFPPEIVKILWEYHGEIKLPSTLESALIHIVDLVVTKFDVLDKATLKSSWNQDIVIYQTLNESSALGLYDRAGLSMNMFLKIRDYLIKEADLY